LGMLQIIWEWRKTDLPDVLRTVLTVFLNNFNNAN
jgi:hypothetical protein